jgi:PRTRC genetic system protein B
MKSIPQFGSVHEFKLSHAILLYGSGRYHSDSLSAATLHEVKEVAGQPAIQPGSPITIDAIEALTQGLGRRLDNCLLSERMLAVSLGQMIWWTPAARRRIWFNPTKGDKHYADLKKLNGKIVAHPPLVFCAADDFTVFALASNKRPTLTTKLFRAPYYNIDKSGVMCTGNVKLPGVINPGAVEGFEKAFFNSAFSHSHWGHQLTRFPGGHQALWQAMTTAKTFPKEHLLSTKHTMAGLLKGINDVED